MKKIVLLLALFMLPLQAFAFRDYMVISDALVRNVTIKDKDIATVRPLQTMDNAKKVIFVSPKKNGKTKITIELLKSIVELDLIVKGDNTFISPHDGFVVIPTDLPGVGSGRTNK